MVKEVKTQAKVNVGVEVVWKALSKDLNHVVPQCIPNLVKNASVVEGDGGIGTVYLFNFGPGVKTMTYQKEKISELDESIHRIALEVVEGGHLNLGFSHYKTTFQLAETAELDTLIDVTVAYETEADDDSMPSKTVSSMLAYIKQLEKYLAKEYSYSL